MLFRSRSRAWPTPSIRASTRPSSLMAASRTRSCSRCSATEAQARCSTGEETGKWLPPRGCARRRVSERNRRRRLLARRLKLFAKRTDEGRTYGSYPVMGGHGSFPLIRPRAGPRPPSPSGEGSCQITSCWAPARPCRPCRGAGPQGWSRCRRPAGGSPGRQSAYAAGPRRCCSACGPAGSCRSHP